MYFGQDGGQGPIDKIIHEKAFCLKKGGLFVECGAYDGITDSSCLFFEKFLNWSGINIEAVPVLFNRLTSNRPNSKNLNYALSNYDGTAKFKHVLRDNLDIGNGSLAHKEGHMNWLLENFNHTFVDVEVEVRKYSTIMKSIFNKIPEVDLFVLDVEGEEMKVLEEFLTFDNIERPNVFCIEYGHIGIENLNDLMVKMNYKILFKDNINCLYKKVC